MTTAQSIICAALVALATGTAARAEETYPPAWPRPGATLLIENDRGAAYDVTYVKDQATAVHQHRYPFVGLDLQTSAIKVTDLDGVGRTFPAVRNNMWFLPRSAPHSEMSTLSPTRHVVVIDIKDTSLPPAPNTTALPADRYAGYQKKGVDNDRVTIWDCAWAPGANGAPSFNSRDMFIVFADGGDLSIGTGDAAPVVKHYDPGQAIFLAGGKVRTFSAQRSTVHVMLVQVK